jgi:hypothetical protein
MAESARAKSLAKGPSKKLILSWDTSWTYWRTLRFTSDWLFEDLQTEFFAAIADFHAAGRVDFVYGELVGIAIVSTRVGELAG